MATSVGREAGPFDGSRYVRLRTKNDGRHQLLTPSPESLTWGYVQRVHACPSRLFAATELKVDGLSLFQTMQTCREMEMPSKVEPLL
jgi:hypothetical protein